MTNFFMKKLNKRGFTLAELLIVVAIIAILIAVAIPIYTGVMQDAQRKVNMSNARALKGAATTEILTQWTEDDGNSQEFSTGASGGDNAKGWIAWAKFDDAGNMGDVTVQVRTKSGASSDSAGYVSATEVKDLSGAEGATDGTKVEDEGSGSITNTNWIVVTLTDTDIGK